MSSSGLSPEYFVACLQEAAVFESQNQRFEATLREPTFEADLEDFRTLALDGITTEQSASFAHLLQKDFSPYEKLAAEHSKTTIALENARNELESSKLANSNKDEMRLHRAAQRASELAPQIQKEAEKLAAERIAETKAARHRDVELKIGQLASSLAELDSLYAIASRPWPMPLAVRSIAKEVLTVDEIPLPPETHVSPEDEITRKLIERHGYTWNASVMLTAHLIKNPDTTFTPEELGGALYTDESHFVGMSEEEKQRCVRMRIHTLLNQNARVVGFVDDEGYRLQYGYRHFLDAATRERVRPKRRIYRVVPRQTGHEAPETFEDICLISEDGMQIETKAIDRVSPSIPAEIQVEKTPNVKTEGDITEEQVMSAITLLNDNGLLPETIDAKLNFNALRFKVLQMKINQGPHRDRLQAIKKSILEAPPALAGRATAAALVVGALQNEVPWKHYKDSSLRKKMLALAEAGLYEFFEKESPTTQE